MLKSKAYSNIPVNLIAVKLGVRRASGNKYYCFNRAAHKNGDRHPSLSISEIGFNCFTCGVSGNGVELVKLLLNLNVKESIDWIETNFNLITEKKNRKGVNLESINIEKYKINLENDNFIKSLMDLTIPIEYIYTCNLGTEKGYTVFIYKNYNNIVENLKAVLYKGLKRNRKTGARFLNKGGNVPLFFEDRLKDNNKNIVLVESEKTAILANYIYDDYLFIATGGTNALTDEKVKVFKNKKITIAFDADEPGRKAALNVKEKLNEIADIVRIYDKFPDRNDGYDLGDYLIELLIKHKQLINSLNENKRGLYEEKAAILQYQNNLSKYDSEVEALKRLGVKNER